ncbi:MAG: hypothetical protein E7166_06380 [Firmicutes bacterium]|nr:hypothetical protein [Clostridiales bacterium]MBE6153830.1 hypothetical protein [Bacillota bacterium]
MSETTIIKIIFGILLSLGALVLFILAFKLYYKYLIQEKRCTAKTKGKIRRYTLASRGGEDSGVHLPIVFYNVNGKEYKVVGPEYRAYKTITKTSPMNKNKMEYQEKGQILTIKRENNSFVAIQRNPIESIFPINSEIDVFYDPSNPKLSYVLRYCNKKNMFYLMLGSALLVLIVDLLNLFLL